MSRTDLEPIHIWGKGGPNPPKVAMILGELDLPHELQFVDFSEVKQPAYLAINPNGRIPAMHDPNTGVTLWESAAIVLYLVETYDKSQRISFAPGTPEHHHAHQWLLFQASGQAPYYGQATWFHKFHAERLPSAVARYVAEMRRVTGVLETWLTKQKAENEGKGGDGPWLVGNRASYADIAFVSWQLIGPGTVEGQGFDADEFPVVKDWLARLTARPGVAYGWSTKQVPGH
ncbi:putative glutathione S-transferase 1 [Lasiosphaeria miniovina]|uniref:Glutathione S-transferase 1 n=1 Tax=Lasiosphaeria miniovina TaxID=1954250 RepID=A0AA40ABG7_9PEZI|nr:putative glutathione S-transferase 1 [Lasiosphaeria miniovina]KAK0712772.1 putative glutathione S-transferase 1 [Lasiosphaeria miniovina]